MQVRCPGCQKLLQIPDQSSATRVRCPGCQNILQVPANDTVETAENPFSDLPPVPPTTPNAASSFPTATGPAQTRPAPAPSPPSNSPKPSGGKFPVWGYLLIAAGVLLLTPILCCGVIGMIGMSRMNGEPSLVMDKGLDAVAVPVSLPDLGPSVQEFPSGVTYHRIRIQGSADKPGSPMDLRVYMPPGEHSDGSLACVLVAPAGTPLLHGASLDGDDYHDETLPYAESGMVVIQYSIDGAIPASVNENDEQAYSNALSTVWPAFKDSGGGIVNGRNALEYALEKIPSVDPNRICAAGHSSAATLALMLAASEPRLHRCVAYAPAYDCESRMDEAINDPITRMLLPGIKGFIEWYSPINHVADYQCPVMIFHARDDDNVPFSDAQRFANEMTSRQKNVHFVKADRGGHYLSMIEKGIPAAIGWLSE